MKKHLFSLTKKDFVIQQFRAGGKGGQHQNKTNSGCRIIHLASGARGEARDTRHYIRNKKNAFRRLTNSSKFQNWLKIEISKKSQNMKELERQVDDSMDESNLLIEYL